MKKNVIVSLADANYFPLLEELINSIKRFKESEKVAICVLDAGLTNEQKEILTNKVDEIKPAEWDIEVPKSKIKDKEWLKSQVSRAFLPNYRIGIMHLAAGIWKDGKDMRVDKTIQIEIENLNNKKILKSLRYKI